MFSEAHSAFSAGAETGMSHGVSAGNISPRIWFSPAGATVGHHGFGSLRCQSGPEGDPVAAARADVDDKVYVFLYCLTHRKPEIAGA